MALGYKNTRAAVKKHIESEDKTTVMICDTGSNYKSKAIFINESGLYALILSSKLESAKRFKRLGDFGGASLHSQAGREQGIQISVFSYFSFYFSALQNTAPLHEKQLYNAIIQHVDGDDALKQCTVDSKGQKKPNSFHQQIRPLRPHPLLKIRKMRTDISIKGISQNATPPYDSQFTIIFPLVHPPLPYNPIRNGVLKQGVISISVL